MLDRAAQGGTPSPAGGGNLPDPDSRPALETVLTEASSVLNPDFLCIPTTTMPPTPQAPGIPAAWAGHVSG